jgi:hypothetical protein
MKNIFYNITDEGTLQIKTSAGYAINFILFLVIYLFYF